MSLCASLESVARGTLPSMSEHGARAERRASLSTHDLQARRAAWRRRRARRRAAWSVLLLFVAVAVAVAAVIVVGSEGSSHRLSEGPGLASRVPVADPDQGLRDRLHHSALSVTGLAFAPIERVLAYTSYVRIGTARKRDVALTFDDGPGPYTPEVLAVLRRLHAPATFFVIGEWARRYPQFVRAEAHDGFEIGDHTETHPFMSALPAAAQQAQIVDAGDAIARAGAPFPRLWRPPYGAFNDATLQILRSLGMLVVLWTVDTSDYARPGLERIWYTALSGARPGAIILMHDGGGNRAETVAALPRIIASLRRRGFRLVTISQLLADDPPPHDQPPPQPLSGLAG
jgi:peptidoglycan-N-acetylglucosamine deacetylase